MSLCWNGLFASILFAIPLLAQQPPSNAMTLPQRLESKARAAEGRADRGIDELASEVFEPFGLASNPMLAPFRSGVVDRVSKAEKQFRSTGHGAIPDTKVKDALNHIVKQMGAPDYALTTDSQVRKLRMDLLPLLPTFLGRGLKKENAPKSNHLLSPLQAVYLTVLMANQKLYSPEYQFAPDEWSNRQQKLAAETASANSDQARKALRDRRHAEQLHQIGLNRKRAELTRLAENFASQHSADELQAVTHEALDKLGLER